MSERAYSIELHRKVRKNELSQLFKSKQLTDIHAFYCLDSRCHTPLTAKATNSNKQTAHFILQHATQPHISNCFEVDQKENEDRFKTEKERINTLQHSHELVTFAAPKPNNISYKSKANIDDFKTLSPGRTNTSSNGSYQSIKKINSTTHSLDIMVDVYENSVDKSEKYQVLFPFEKRDWPDVKAFEINGTSGKKSLKDIFYPISNLFPVNQFKIFFGSAYLIEIKEGLISINFENNGSVHIYTNKKKLLNLPEKDIIQKAIQNQTPLIVYCQGAIELIHQRNGDEFRIVTVTNHIYRSLFFKLE